MTTTNTATRCPALSARARRTLARSMTATTSDRTIQVEFNGADATLDELVEARLIEVVRVTSDATGQGGADRAHIRATDRGARSFELARAAGLV